MRVPQERIPLEVLIHHTPTMIDFFESMMGRTHEVMVHGQRCSARFPVEDYEIRDCKNSTETYMMIRKKFAKMIKMNRSLRRKT